MGNVGLSASAESVHHAKRPSRRGSRHGHVHRSSSRRNKENGSSRSNSFRNKASGAKGNSGIGGGGGGGNGSGANEANNLGNSSVANKEYNRIRKQRAVSFEQTSALTGTTMTTSASGCPMLVVGPINPKWREHASKSLDEKKLLSKQNNIGGGGPLIDGDADLAGEDSASGSCGGPPAMAVDADSDGDWHMMDQSQQQTTASAVGQSQSSAPSSVGTAPSSMLHHFKPPRI